MSPEPDSQPPQDPEALKKKLEDYLSEGEPSIPQPEPKREEEEKKKGGAALPAGAQSGTGGAGIGASASGSAGLGRLAGIVIRGAAPAGAGSSGSAAALWGKLGALLMSKGFVVLTATAIVAGAGAALTNHRPSASQNPIVRRLVADMRSAIPVHRVNRDLTGMSLSLFAQAMKKELGWGAAGEQPGAAAPAAADQAASSSAAGAAAADAAGGASPGVLAEGEEAGGEGKKFVQPRLKSSSLGAGGSFGGRDIFSGSGISGGAPKFGDGFDRGKIIGFQGPQKAKASGGRLIAGRPAGSSYARVKGLDKSSRSLAQLRGMRTMNPSLRAGGARASEANREAALEQFEATRVDGAGSVPALPDGTAAAQVPATPGGLGGTGGTTGSTASEVDPVDTCTDQQYWDGSACKSIYTSTPGQNATPWQDKADQAKDLILAGCLLGLLATVLYKIYDKIKNGPQAAYATVILIAALVCLLAAVACAVAAISLGSQINSMGGSPQGTLDMVAGGAVILGTLAAMFGEGSTSTYGAVALAILFICELVAQML
ncbi:MAG: hypothetical protein PHU21_02385 [Elusimicrobia bacterium]|nr:hypothetical protein [Elusimicrobiota bacterium]